MSKQLLLDLLKAKNNIMTLLKRKTSIPLGVYVRNKEICATDLYVYYLYKTEVNEDYYFYKHYLEFLLKNLEPERVKKAENIDLSQYKMDEHQEIAMVPEIKRVNIEFKVKKDDLKKVLQKVYFPIRDKRIEPKINFLIKNNNSIMIGYTDGRLLLWDNIEIRDLIVNSRLGSKEYISTFALCEDGMEDFVKLDLLSEYYVCKVNDSHMEMVGYNDEEFSQKSGERIILRDIDVWNVNFDRVFREGISNWEYIEFRKEFVKSIKKFKKEGILIITNKDRYKIVDRIDNELFSGVENFGGTYSFVEPIKLYVKHLVYGIENTRETRLYVCIDQKIASFGVNNQLVVILK